MALLCGAAALLLLLSLSRAGGTTAAGDYVPETCEDVRLRCAFGTGCSLALHNYFIKCDRILQTNPTTCPETCLYSLVALTSTDDGKRLLDCTCRDRYCVQIKSRLEVCRPLVVEMARNETVVPCELAQWLCMVDPVCDAALGYYTTYCKRMIQGSVCTERCLNSIEILQRQESAAKMNRCRCTGRLTVECLRNKERMVRLCYGGGGGGSGTAADSEPRGKSGGRKNRKKHKPRMFDEDPDRAEVEMMMADPDYEPEIPNEYNTSAAPPDEDAGGDNASSCPAVRAPPLAVLCALTVAAHFLVGARSWSVVARGGQ